MANTLRQNAHLEAIANAMPDPIFVMGYDGTYLDVIGGQERTLYADGHALIGKNYFDVLPEKMAQRFLNVVQKAIETKRLVEIEYQLANEEVNGIEADNAPKGGQWYEARIYPLEEDIYDQPAAIWLAINITKRKHMEEQIEHLSTTDPLTGLYNRDFFLQLVDEELKKSEIENAPLSFAKIDLDCFKRVTDLYGLEVGDKAMSMAALAIQKTAGDLGYIGRLSCDQFMILFPEVKVVDAFRITQLAQKAITSQTIPLPDGKTTCLTSHAGVTEKRSPEDTSQTLLQRANEAIQEVSTTREITKIK
jgi:diguanylate cyclase (GGDEF)-like protein